MKYGHSFSSSFWHQFFRYCLSGGIAAGIDTTLVVFLTEYFGVPYLLSTTIGFFAGLSTIYLLSMRWVFPATHKKSKKEHTFFFFGFGIIGIFGLLLSLLFMWIFYEKLSFSLLMAKLITTFLVLWWNFLARRTMLS